MTFETEQALEEVYFKAHALSRNTGQKVGEKNDLYITIEQLMDILLQIKNNLGQRQ